MKARNIILTLNHIYSCPVDVGAIHATTLQALLRRQWVEVRDDYLCRPCAWLTPLGVTEARKRWG
jgi:hypothetical protein